MTEKDQDERGVPFPEKTGDPVDLSEDASNEDADQDDSTNDSEPDEKLISQKELDRILQKRLKRQEEQFQKKLADYDKLKEDAEAFQKLQDEKATDAERWDRERTSLITERDEAKSELTKLQRANLIADLATDKGLPKSFWRRVQGETEEEIAEDIESIVEDLGLDKDQGSGKGKTPKPRKRQVYGGGGENEDPDPDTDSIVSAVPRGPQFRTEQPRTYK